MTIRFINNWITQLTEPIAIGSLTAVIDPAALSKLGDSEYRLVLAESLNAMDMANNFEIVKAVVSGGQLTLEREQEQTAAREWPVGSVMFMPVTAEVLNQMLAGLSAGGGSGAGPWIDIIPTGGWQRIADWPLQGRVSADMIELRGKLSRTASGNAAYIGVIPTDLQPVFINEYAPFYIPVRRYTKTDDSSAFGTLRLAGSELYVDGASGAAEGDEIDVTGARFPRTWL